MDREEQIRRYFERLELPVPEVLEPTGELLRQLHYQHTMRIPFENTDYLTGDVKAADFETQFEEVIIHHRGGICMDLNPLFGGFLALLGYEVECRTSLVCTRPADDFNYHVIVIARDMEGQNWWCDIANPFVRFCEPIPINIGEEVSASGGLYRFEKSEEGQFTLFEKDENGWRARFITQDTPADEETRSAVKLGAPAKYPDTSMLNKPIFSIATPAGRKSLFGNIFREPGPEGLIRKECTEEDLPWAYAQFGLKMKTGDGIQTTE